MEVMCEVSSSLPKPINTIKGNSHIPKSDSQQNPSILQCHLGKNETCCGFGNTTDQSFESRKKQSVTSVDQMDRSFRDLKISSLDLDTINNSYNAGNIKSIIATINAVVIQPVSGDNLLYLGTPLFVKKRNAENCSIEDYILLGIVDDIFGSIGEPMYKVQTSELRRDMFNIGEEVFYFANNSQTRLMCIEQSLDCATNKITHRVRTRRTRQ